ncbi:MAG: hypothetical protein CMF59_04080 [Leptospiraceae bacterium]|mgnify:CR=1 FL=1|nr:hypothetical protein [Leptospiraceae bacterium]
MSGASEFKRKLAAAEKTFLKSLSPSALQNLVSQGLFIDFPEGSVLYRPGEESHMLLIDSGEGRMWIESADGRRMVVRHFGSGEIIGLVACMGGPANLTVETIQATSALAISSEIVQRVASVHPEVGFLFAQQCAIRVYGMMDELNSMTFDSVSRRLARCLIRLSRESMKPVNLRITQQELADTIATSREVVARNLKEFRERGFVSTESDSPGLIFIKDPTALRRYYEESTPV